MKKRLIAYLLTAAMLLGLLSGCGSQEETVSDGNGGTEATKGDVPSDIQTPVQEPENPIRPYQLFTNAATHTAYVTTFDGDYATIPNCDEAWMLPDRQHVLYLALTESTLGLDRIIYLADVDALDSPTELYAGDVFETVAGRDYFMVNIGEVMKYILEYDTLEFHYLDRGNRIEIDENTGDANIYLGCFYIEQRPDENNYMVPHYYLATKNHGNIPLDGYVPRVLEAFSVYDPETDEYFFSLTGKEDLRNILYRCKDGQITEMLRAKDGSEGAFIPQIDDGVLSILYNGNGEATSLLRPKGSTEFITVDNTSDYNASLFRVGTEEGLYTVCSMNPEDHWDQSLCFMGNDGSFSVLTKIAPGGYGNSIRHLGGDRILYYDENNDLYSARLADGAIQEQHFLMAYEDQVNQNSHKDAYIRYLEQEDALILKSALGCFLTPFDGEGKVTLGTCWDFYDLGTSADGKYLFGVTGRGRELVQWKVADLMKAARSGSTADPAELGTVIDDSVYYPTVTSGMKYLDPDEMLYMTTPTSGLEFTFKLKKGADITVIGQDEI